MNAHQHTGSLDMARTILAVTSAAVVPVFNALLRGENSMPFNSMMIIGLGIPLSFFTSMIAVVRRDDCGTIANAMERIGILIFAVVFFGLENLALLPGNSWVSWTCCSFFFLSLLALSIIRRYQRSDEGTEMEVQHSNGDNIESHETTDISQELDVAKAVIGFAFLAVVGLVTTPVGQIIPPRTSLWFLALVNSVAFSTSLLWIWHSRDFPQFAKAMKVIGVLSIVLTFFVFLDLKFSNYRWAIWLSFAMLLLCLAPYNMLSNIYQFIIEKIRYGIWLMKLVCTSVKKLLLWIHRWYIESPEGGPQGQGAAEGGPQWQGGP